MNRVLCLALLLATALPPVAAGENRTGVNITATSRNELEAVGGVWGIIVIAAAILGSFYIFLFCIRNTKYGKQFLNCFLPA